MFRMARNVGGETQVNLASVRRVSEVFLSKYISKVISPMRSPGNVSHYTVHNLQPQLHPRILHACTYII